jgi:predicted component of type VI protein secretion system
LESITHVSSKVIHVVNMLAADQVKIGRGHDVDVRITDISVSRLHAVVRRTEKGYFYLQDNKSKFGTLSLARNPVLIQNGEVNYI